MLKWGRIQKWECKCFYLLFLYKKGMGYVYNFLNNEANRKLKFIEILHRQDDWITLSKIAEELDCSDKILRSDIKKINIDFSPFMIISSPNGVLLEYPHTINIEYIYSKTLRTSIEYQVIEHLFLNPGITITELSEILYTSEPGLRRKIKALSRQTEESGFNIEIIDSHCNLVGEEAQVRNFLVYYFFEKMYYEDAPFSSTERQVVGKIMDYLKRV
ncbi:Mga helix-turn-helix domain protein (fragment) [Carnobacterium maltaromaticum]